LVSPSFKPSAAQLLTTAAAFVIVVAGMKAATPIVVPFLLSVFIAVISAPPLFWLERRGLPRPLALLTVIAAIVAVGTAITVVVGQSVKSFTANVATYKERLAAQASGLFEWLEARGVPVTWSDFSQVLDPGRVMQMAADVFDGFSGVLTNGFLILFTVVFILFEASSFPGKLRAVVADPDRSLARFDVFTAKVRQYLVIKSWTSIGTGLLVGTWLAVQGVDFPVLWGMLAFLLNYVPNIGSIIAAVPAVLFALIEQGPGGAALAGAGFVVANTVFGTVLEPRLMGRGLGLSTLVVFLSLVFWGWILGPVGMFLSVPLTMTVRIALESRDDTRWIAVLRGPGGAVAEPIAEAPTGDTPPSSGG
jgi:predicted PurR-regulated permease PerM